MHPSLIREWSPASSAIDASSNTVDVLFSFDTTGSMSSVIGTVRKNLRETVDRLYQEIAGINIGIIVHGDYCDYPTTLWMLPPTRDIDAVRAFIKHGPNTNGGDYEECYELVLHAATKIEWKSPVKVLVVIGDATPHEEGYSIDHYGVPGPEVVTIDWKHQVQLLKNKQVSVFACHALAHQNHRSLHFYEHISKETGGYYFCLSDLSAFSDYMVAICMRAADASDAIDILNKRQLELKAKMATAKDAELIRELRQESTQIDEALQSSQNYSVFSPETENVAAKYRESAGKNTRLEKYEDELKHKTPTFFQNKDASNFLNVLSNRKPATCPEAKDDSVSSPPTFKLEEPVISSHSVSGYRSLLLHGFGSTNCHESDQAKVDTVRDQEFLDWIKMQKQDGKRKQNYEKDEDFRSPTGRNIRRHHRSS